MKLGKTGKHLPWQNIAHVSQITQANILKLQQIVSRKK